MESTELGRRLREIRSWRQMSLRATAELSGISHSYLAKLERGEKPVNNRQVLESLARTLRVSPAELAGKPYAPVDQPDEATRAGLLEIEDTLAGWLVGEGTGAQLRPWNDIQADLHRLNTVLRRAADFTAQVEILPGLIRELLTLSGSPAHRRRALIGLIGAYKSVAYVSFDLGIRGLPSLAVDRMRQAAEELDDPAIVADVAWRRAQILSGSNRTRQYQLAAAVADDPSVPAHLQGMAHLIAAMASAAQGQEDTAQGRLAEASALADLIDTDDEPWTKTDFGRTNVGIWRVSIGVELGYGAKVAEIARVGRPPQTLPVAHRQAAFWMDLGRGLLTERKSRDQGLAAILKAEKLTPQKVRNNVFVRELVAELLGATRRDAGGRELRGLAWRMGVAPTG